jgi:anti-sigma factor RsiW
MHARIDQLLSLRDGAPVSAEVRAHVDSCPECAASLARADALRARMRALPPAPEPVVDGWAAVRERVSAAREPRRAPSRIGPLAAAASVGALALFAALRWRESPPLPTIGSPPTVTASSEELDDLRARSRALESALAALPDRPAVERAGTSVPIDSLEAQVQWLDHQLSVAGADGRGPEAQRLWRDRVEVMNSLVQLRYVEAQHLVY